MSDPHLAISAPPELLGGRGWAAGGLEDDPPMGGVSAPLLAKSSPRKL